MGLACAAAVRCGDRCLAAEDWFRCAAPGSWLCAFAQAFDLCILAQFHHFAGKRPKTETTATEPGVHGIMHWLVGAVRSQNWNQV